MGGLKGRGDLIWDLKLMAAGPGPGSKLDKKLMKRRK